MTYIVHMSVPVHTTPPCSICFSVFVFVVPPCPYGRTSEHAAATWHHWVESLLLHGQSALIITFSPTVTSWCELPVFCADVGSTRESHGAATSSSVSCPQVTLSATHPQVQTDPTRTITNDLLSATLAEAATQLSFCCLSGALHLCQRLRRPSCQSPPHLWMPLRRLFHTPLPLGTFLRNPRSVSSWLHLLSLMFSALRVFDQSPRYFLMRLCKHLYKASRLMMPPHSYRSRSSSSGASSPITLQTAKPRHRHIAMLGAPHRLNLLTLLRIAAPAAPAMLATVTSTLRPHMSPPGLEKYARQFASHGIPVKAAPVRPRLYTAISVTPPQPPVSTTQVGTHPVRSATTYKRSASTALAGTHNPFGADPRTGTGPFPKPRALVLPMVKFGQSKPDGLGHIDTVGSDLMHHQYRVSVLQWNPGPARTNPTNIIADACGKFHAVILQES